MRPVNTKGLRHCVLIVPVQAPVAQLGTILGRDHTDCAVHSIEFLSIRYFPGKGMAHFPTIGFLGVTISFRLV